MEYSLNHLSSISNLKELTLTNLINSLNLIGLEIDEISKKPIKAKYCANNIKILIKLPSNREDLLIEDFFLDELSVIFLFEISNIWKKLKKKYNFLLKQKYYEYKNYSTVFINTNYDSIITYIIEIEKFQNLSSPLWIRNKLKNSGIEILGYYSDILNLVIFEWGQLINQTFFHSFDKKTSNYKIEILSSSEFFLDKTQKLIELAQGTIVLKDNLNTILTILGFLKNPIENNNSNKFLLEISFYDIEKNNLSINVINPKISLKNFRKMFLDKLRYSFQRLLTLTEILGYGSIIPIKYCTPKQKLLLNKNKIIRLKKNSLENILGIEKINENLFAQAGLKIVCKTNKELYFKIPNSRKDLSREIDLIEEYSRFFGYKSFLEIPPLKQNIKKKTNSQSIIFLKQYFLNYGFYEIITNSINEKSENCLERIEIENPLTKELSALRTSLLPKILEIFINNLRLSNSSNNFFEIGRVFKKYKNQILEENKVAAVFQIPLNLNSKENSLEWFSALGFIENILKYFGYDQFEKEKLVNSFSYLHPNRSIIFKKGKKILGIFGEISPTYENYSYLKNATYFVELNLIHFNHFRQYSFPFLYAEYSKYPKIIKDLSCSLNKNINFQNIKFTIEKNSNYLKNILFFDIYQEKNNNEIISIGIRLEFQSTKNTLTNDIIEGEIEKIKNLLILNFNVKIRE